MCIYADLTSCWVGHNERTFDPLCTVRFSRLLMMLSATVFLLPLIISYPWVPPFYVWQARGSQLSDAAYSWKLAPKHPTAESSTLTPASSILTLSMSMLLPSRSERSTAPKATLYQLRALRIQVQLEGNRKTALGSRHFSNKLNQTACLKKQRHNLGCGLYQPFT